MNNYDVVVIGAGPGGYVCAIQASQLGLKTAIVEKQYMGGVCLNVGCIPSKALLKNASVAHLLRKEAKTFGFKFDNLELDYSAAVKRSRKVSGRLTAGVDFLMKKNKIDVFNGSAVLEAGKVVAVTDGDGKEEKIGYQNVVLATGAHSFTPPGWEVDGKKVLSYTEAILQETAPKSVVVIGGGAIGVEFSTVWSGYGVDVTIVEMQDHLVPSEDEDAVKVLAKALKKRGVKALVSTKVEKIETTKSGVKVTVSNADGTQELVAEQALVSIGFKPNVQNLGLETVGVKLTDRGFVEIDDSMKTNVDGVWAIGDVTGKLMLAHAASAMGMACAKNIAGKEAKPIDYRFIPRAVYSTPQVASFGYTEAQAKDAGFDLAVGTFNFQVNGKALGLDEGEGFVKILSDEKTGEILGASMVGPDVSELIPELVLAHNEELTAEEVAHAIHAHPTLSEVVMEAAHGVHGLPIHS